MIVLMKVLGRTDKSELIVKPMGVLLPVPEQLQEELLREKREVDSIMANARKDRA